MTTATPHSVYGNQHSVSNPEWVTNSRTLVFGGYGRQVAIDDLDAGDYNAKPWMVPNGDMGDGEVSRDGKRLAVTDDYGANTKLAFYAVDRGRGDGVPARVSRLSCSTTAATRSSATSSWSPDGSGIAYESSAGITISRFTKFLAGDCEAPNDFVLSATGSEPDWGPADAARRRLQAAGRHAARRQPDPVYAATIASRARSSRSPRPPPARCARASP